MTFFDITEKHETLKHFVIKCLVYYSLKAKGHKVQLEYKSANGCIIDVFDKDSGLAYEIQGVMSKEILKHKYITYLKSVEIKDIIPIPLGFFTGFDIRKWNQLLNKFIP